MSPAERARIAQIEADLIAQYLRDKGVTKCPTAFAAETNVAVNPADAAIHKARGLDPMGDLYRKKHPARGWKKYWALKRKSV